MMRMPNFATMPSGIRLTDVCIITASAVFRNVVVLLPKLSGQMLPSFGATRLLWWSETAGPSVELPFDCMLIDVAWYSTCNALAGSYCFDDCKLASVEPPTCFR